MARWLCAALCVITVSTIASQAPADQSPFSDPGPSASPRLTQLKAALKSRGRSAALATFWADIHRGGAPLIEAVPGEPNYSWVTFLWQAAGKTTNVAVVDGVAAGIDGVDATKSLMFSIEGTDVWYRIATTASGKTIVAGSSLGGLASAFAAFQHPEVFGNVLSQSGSRGRFKL